MPEREGLRVCSHDQRDEKRRCWNCGAVDHIAPACGRPKETKEGGGKPKISKAKKEKPTSGKQDCDGGSEEQRPSRVC